MNLRHIKRRCGAVGVAVLLSAAPTSPTMAHNPIFAPGAHVTYQGGLEMSLGYKRDRASGGGARETGIAGGGAAIRPENLCLVGVRSYEPEERELLDRLGVRVIHMDEVARRGIGWALDEALRIAGAGTAAVGLSIDLDAVDPCDAPGVGSPVPGGIEAGELVDSLARLCRQTRFLGVEIVEFDPSLDEGGATERLVRDLLAATHSAGGRP